jgi:hypothetical protein
MEGTGLTDDLEQTVHLIHAPFLFDDDIGGDGSEGDALEEAAFESEHGTEMADGGCQLNKEDQGSVATIVMFIYIAWLS